MDERSTQDSRAKRRQAAVEPINAARAAKRAAHTASPEEGARLRAAAAGTARRSPADGKGPVRLGAERAPAAASRPRPRHASSARASGVHATRRAPQKRPAPSRPQACFPRGLTIACVVIGALLAALLVYILGRAVLGAMLAPDAVDEAGTSQPAQVDQAVTYKDGATIDYGDVLYAIQVEEDGTAAVVRGSASGDDGISLFQLPGEPAGLAVYHATVYAVSNTDAGYQVQAYMYSSGAMPTVVTEGEGTVVGVALDGSKLQLTDEAGRVFSLDLESR